MIPLDLIKLIKIYAFLETNSKKINYEEELKILVPNQNQRFVLYALMGRLFHIGEDSWNIIVNCKGEGS